MPSSENVYAEVRIIPSVLSKIEEFKSCQNEYLKGNTSRFDDYIQQMMNCCDTVKLADQKELLSAIKLNFKVEDFEFNRSEATELLRYNAIHKRRNIRCLFEYLYYYLCFPAAKQVFFMQGGFHLPIDLFNNWLDTQPAIEQLYWYGETSINVIEEIHCQYCSGTFESFLIEDRKLNKYLWKASRNYNNFLFGEYTDNLLEDESRIVIQKTL
jgi:hypothetical protein